MWAVGWNVERCAMWNEAECGLRHCAIRGSGGGVMRDVVSGETDHWRRWWCTIMVGGSPTIMVGVITVRCRGVIQLCKCGAREMARCNVA